MPAQCSGVLLVVAFAVAALAGVYLSVRLVAFSAPASPVRPRAASDSTRSASDSAASDQAGDPGPGAAGPDPGPGAEAPAGTDGISSVPVARPGGPVLVAAPEPGTGGSPDGASAQRRHRPPWRQ
jgi:hypothetical protein